jgi:hypothetical protein
VRVLQERNSAVSYRGRWSHVYRSSASAQHVSAPRGGKVRSKLGFYGKQVAWVSPTSLEGGRAAVFVDGRYVRTVDLASANPTDRRIAFSYRFEERGRHTIAVRPLNGRAVAVDAFVVLR